MTSISNVHALDTPLTDMISTLEDLLAAVKNGDFTAISVAAIGIKEDNYAANAGEGNRYELMGLLEYNKAALLREIQLHGA